MASAAHAEAVLYTYLSDSEALDVLTHEGFLTEEIREVIPTETGRRILAWALETYFASGRTIAPTQDAIVETWGDAMESAHISLGDGTETDSIQWAIEQLRAHHALVHSVGIVNSFGKKMKSADPVDRVKLVEDVSERLYLLTQRLVSHRKEFDGYHGFADALLRYREREADNGLRGMTFGIDVVDEHTYGIHDGEICVVSSSSGTGKSWFAGFVAVNEWRRGRKVVLITLENDLKMTYDRLACIATGTDYQLWQRAQASKASQQAVMDILDLMKDSTCRPLVVQLPPEQCTASGCVRKALLADADSLIVDQLSFLHAEGDVELRRSEQVRSTMHSFQELINNGPHQLPLLLLSQLNREGSKAKGEIVQEHLADSSGVEQFASSAWAIYRGGSHASMGTAELRELKSRRTKWENFTLNWQPERGCISEATSGQGTQHLNLSGVR